MCEVNIKEGNLKMVLKKMLTFTPLGNKK